MKTVDTEFSAVEHGFRFRNSFDIPDTMRLMSLRRKLPPVILEEVVYGLCGGMCFAALDYFHQQMPVPALSKVDDMSPDLFRYLWARQLDSLKYGVLRKVLSWTLRRDKSLARSAAVYEVPKLRTKIDAGEPAVLALIRAGGVVQMMQNHQVLATGYDYAPQSGGLAIRLYDPNHPRHVPTLRLNIAAPKVGINLTQSSGEALRSFFVINYGPKTPP
jgi:hypothetical protein